MVMRKDADRPDREGSSTPPPKPLDYVREFSSKNKKAILIFVAVCVAMFVLGTKL